LGVKALRASSWRRAACSLEEGPALAKVNFLAK
jgi:hypothetical protein